MTIKEKPFGGKTILFGRIFRQIVIPNSSRQDLVHSSLNKSYLWEICTVLKLIVNMRLCPGDDQTNEARAFADWILQIDDGNIGIENDSCSVVEFPEESLIPDFDDHENAIIEETYDNLLLNLWNLIFKKDLLLHQRIRCITVLIA